jgi:hypothetical protein
MKLIRNIFLGILALILVIAILVRVFLHEPKPKIQESDRAEQLADSMLEALNADAWDSLRYLSWSFPGGHNYAWDKSENLALISWKDNVVHLNLDKVDGRVFVDGVEVTGKRKDKLIKKAWRFWCNDSFWFFAPYKIKDQGTTLAVAKDKNGREGLLVTYESGGVTPGDHYLWFMDEKGMPIAVKMWVKVLPFGGLYSEWTDWETSYSGAKLSTTRIFNIGNFEMIIENIKSSDSWKSLDYTDNPILLRP